MKSAMNKSPSAARQNLVRVSPGVYRNASGALVGPRGRALSQQQPGGQQAGQQVNQQLQNLGMQAPPSEAGGQVSQTLGNLQNGSTMQTMQRLTGSNQSSDKMYRGYLPYQQGVAQNLQQLQSGQAPTQMTPQQIQAYMAPNPSIGQQGFNQLQQQFGQAQQIQQNVNPVQAGFGQGNFMGYRRPGGMS